jgi:isopentenyl-diphosphate delta-isomerase
MGIAINPNKLSVLYAYRYQADFDDYLSEHELNHVIVGEWDDEHDFNRDEVEEVQWIRWDELVKDVHQLPSKYADWFVLMVKNERLQKEFEI